jgi:dienelactone hydrolase
MSLLIENIIPLQRQPQGVLSEIRKFPRRKGASDFFCKNPRSTSFKRQKIMQPHCEICPLKYSKTMKQQAYSLALVLLLHNGLSTWAQPVPHHFSGINVLPDSTTVLSLDGSVSNMFNLDGVIATHFAQTFDLYPVEASTNLKEWVRLAILLRTNNNPHPLQFADASAIDSSHRFYRTPTNHQITLFPAPTGPFAVGCTDRVMIDPARTNLYRYSPRTNSFMVTFWYPAESSNAGTPLGRMWDARIAADTTFYSFVGADSRWAEINSRVVGHRFSDIAVEPASSGWPVIIYSHGQPLFRKSASHQAEELASHGYIVVALDHPDCWATEFPDGRYLLGNQAGDVPGRLMDNQFLLNELAVVNNSDPILAGKLDLDHIALFGVSFGGEVVQTARSDSRVKCVAIYDATNVLPGGPGLQKPLLVMAGQTNLFSAEDLVLFTNSSTNAVILQLKTADHPTCLDYAWWGEIPWGRSPALAIDACLVWFFDTYLKGESPPFPTNPWIQILQKK